MPLQTISQVSRFYGVSPRMLRYYEQAGLIESQRREDYAYRVYDEANLTKLRQIIVLRKLRVPVKQIAAILQSSGAAEAVEIFRQNISQLDAEITALSTVKAILTRFVEEIREKADVQLQLLGEEALLASALTFSDNKIKEGEFMVEELNRANQQLDKYEDKDVRIVSLPPMVVAAAYASGESCEGTTGGMIYKFVTETDLLKKKPDARSFGFDCSEGATGVGQPSHTYEMWVSIPEDMPVPVPLIRREFRGGMYAAHVLTNWDFHDWRLLSDWVNSSDKYDNDADSPRWESKETVSCGGIEETLNYSGFVQHNGEMKYMQLDLLFPIKEKETV
jgi:DNA-binding transcriptional MerR regulator